MQAVLQLGITAAGVTIANVTVVDRRDAPSGCFVDKAHSIYFNPSGSLESNFNFVKAVCGWRERTGLDPPEPVERTINACGTNRTMDVFDVPAWALESMLNNLRNRSRPFAIRS